MRRDHHRDEEAQLGQPRDVADLILLAVTQSPRGPHVGAAVYATSNPEIEMVRHWE